VRAAPGPISCAPKPRHCWPGTVDDLVGGTPVRMGVAFVVLGTAWAALAVAGIAVPLPLALGAAAVVAQAPVGQRASANLGYGLTLAVAVASDQG
jgi:hypothetical protein